MDVTQFFQRVTEVKQESQYLRLKIGNKKGYSCLIIEDIGYEVLSFEQANEELRSWYECLGDQNPKPPLPKVNGEFIRCYIPDGPPCFFCVDSVLSVDPSGS